MKSYHLYDLNVSKLQCARFYISNYLFIRLLRDNIFIMQQQLCVHTISIHLMLYNNARKSTQLFNIYTKPARINKCAQYRDNRYFLKTALNSCSSEDKRGQQNNFKIYDSNYKTQQKTDMGLINTFGVIYTFPAIVIIKHIIH